MEWLSELKQNDTIYYIDRANIQSGIKEVKVKSVTHEHVDEIEFNYGCGYKYPDTWYIRFEVDGFGEKTIQFHDEKTSKYYLEFSDLKNINGKAEINKYYYLVCHDRKLLIDILRNENQTSLNSYLTKIEYIKIELANAIKNKEKCEENLEYINQYGFKE